MELEFRPLFHTRLVNNSKSLNNTKELEESESNSYLNSSLQRKEFSIRKSSNSTKRKKNGGLVPDTRIKLTRIEKSGPLTNKR